MPSFLQSLFQKLLPGVEAALLHVLEGLFTKASSAPDGKIHADEISAAIEEVKGHIAAASNSLENA